MALRTIRISTSVITFLAAAMAVPSYSVRAQPDRAAGLHLPSLADFRESIADGRADQLRGAYAPGLFAYIIVQQPVGEIDFVASEPESLTEFRAADDVGAIGLLAHNYLAGRDFAAMKPGRTLYLIYGDGRIASYVVRDALRYRALQPRSPYSSFVDLADGRQVTSGDVFQAVYGRPRALVLQTCIEKDGLLTWGRLFVVAQPVTRRAPPQFHCPDCS